MLLYFSYALNLFVIPLLKMQMNQEANSTYGALAERVSPALPRSPSYSHAKTYATASTSPASSHPPSPYHYKLSSTNAPSHRSPPIAPSSAEYSLSHAGRAGV